MTDDHRPRTAPADVVRRQYLASAAGDLEALRATLAPDVEWTEMAGFPLAGTYRTPDGVTSNVMEKLGAGLGRLDRPRRHLRRRRRERRRPGPLHRRQQGHRQADRRPRRPPLHRPRRPDRPLRAVRRHRPGPRRHARLGGRSAFLGTGRDSVHGRRLWSWASPLIMGLPARFPAPWPTAREVVGMPDDFRLLSRPGAGCRDGSRSVSPDRSPNPRSGGGGVGLRTRNEDLDRKVEALAAVSL